MTNAVQQSPDLFEQAIAISISMEGFGRGQRKVSLNGVEVDADKDRLGLEALILRCPETAAINALFGRVRLAMGDPAKGKALPTFFKRGVFLVPFANLRALHQMLKDFQAELMELVARLEDVYELRIAEDKIKLREKFSLAHYPKKSALRSRFSISWRYLELAPSGRLASISPEIYDEEVAAVRLEVQSMGDEIKRGLRQAALKIVNHLATRLGTDPASGKKNVLHDSAIDNVMDFLNAFESKNLMRDHELAGTLRQMREIISGVEGKELRSDEALREQIAARVNGLLPVLDSLVTTVGRSVELPDDDDASAAA